MFTLGIVLLTTGCMLKIWVTLTTREETRSLSPQKISHRTYTIRTMRQRMRYSFIESIILIAIGTVIILKTAVFN